MKYTECRDAVAKLSYPAQLIGSVYDEANSEATQDKERQWQDRAVEFLLANAQRPIQRTMFDNLSEYERGPISEACKMGYAG